MKLYLASGNAHKVAEMNALARADGLAVEIISAKSAGGMPPVVAMCWPPGIVGDRWNSRATSPIVMSRSGVISPPGTRGTTE